MRPRGIALSVLPFIGLATLLFASAPPWPDDWDGIGFALSIERFDLDQFIPHPPGYPVYVVLLRAAALVVHDRVAAANTVAILSGLTAIGLISLAGKRALGSARAAAWLGAFVALAPLVWRTSTAVGSEAPALAIAAAGLASATASTRRAAWGIGAAVGIGLGVRLSWAPLYLALLLLVPRGERLRASLVAVGATVAWALPLAWIVGPSHLARLAVTHADGHFHTWGGTTLREPGPRRLVYLARDVLVDGIGMDRDALGIAIGACALVLLAIGARAWQRRGWPHARLLLLLLPYLLWIAFGQNLRQQPRHALPIVVTLAAALAFAAASSRLSAMVGGLLVVLLGFRTAGDARARRMIAPPGAQLVDYVTALPNPHRVAVFAGPSARFFDLSPSPLHAQTVGTLGDARLAIGRSPSIPDRLIVTNELERLDSSGERLLPIASFCRPPRIDRRAPCIEAYDWVPSFLPRR
jgi:hypothetical protein